MTVSQKLGKLQFVDATLQNQASKIIVLFFSTNILIGFLLQVYFLRMEISDFPIQISATDFLDIDCHLVPKVI